MSFRTMLNNSGDSDHLCSDFNRNTSTISACEVYCRMIAFIKKVIFIFYLIKEFYKNKKY